MRLPAWERREMVYAGAALAAILLLLVSIALHSRARAALATIEAKRGEVLALRDEFLSLRRSLGAAARTDSAVNVRGVVEAVDGIFVPLGLRQKVQSVKQLGSRRLLDGTEEEAEVRVERVDMNEMINIFFSVETSPMAVSIRKATVRKSFETPSLLDVTLTLSHFAPEG